MDAWTQLCRLLQSALCLDDDLAEALELAIQADSTAPQDCKALLREQLDCFMATTADARIMSAGTEVVRRFLSGSGAPTCRQERAEPIAQEIDRADENLDWWP